MFIAYLENNAHIVRIIQNGPKGTRSSWSSERQPAAQLLRAVGAKEVGEVRIDPKYDWESLRRRAFDDLGHEPLLPWAQSLMGPNDARTVEEVAIQLAAQRRLASRQAADIAALIHDLLEPPLAEVGALPMDAFVSSAQRAALAASLNALLVAPTFSSWREGTSLDVGSWLTKNGPRTPGVVFSVAHLEEEQRALVLGLLLDEVLSWVRTLSGTRRLRALVVVDEVFGLLPPRPANPPTKGRIVSLMKQARAYGVGILLATQNPMDLDYRALSNAGLWCIGRLQTDADRARVIDGLSLSGAGTGSAKELHRTVKKLAKKWFVLRDVHDEMGLKLFQPRWAYSFMRGPMTREEIRRAVG